MYILRGKVHLLLGLRLQSFVIIALVSSIWKEEPWCWLMVVLSA
ncbi:hypothetical protein Hanom_Chr02g00139511 [Helianthus anomalus]